MDEMDEKTAKNGVKMDEKEEKVVKMDEKVVKMDEKEEKLLKWLKKKIFKVLKVAANKGFIYRFILKREGIEPLRNGVRLMDFTAEETEVLRDSIPKENKA